MILKYIVVCVWKSQQYQLKSHKSTEKNQKKKKKKIEKHNKCY